MSGSSDLRAVLKLLQISGLAPYSLGKDGTHTGRSCILAAYCLFLTTSIMCNMVLAERDERNNVDYPNKSFLIRISFDSVDVLENIHPCFVIIRCLIYANDNIGIWFKIKQINKKLKELNVEFDNRKLAMFIYAQTVIFLILSVSFIATDIFLCSRLGIYYTANYWILCGLPLILNSITETTFGGLVWILYQRFWVINAFLSYFIHCKRDQCRQQFLVPGNPQNVDKSLESIRLNSMVVKEVYLPRACNLKKVSKVQPLTTPKPKIPPFFVTKKNFRECVGDNFFSQSINISIIRSLKIIHFDLFEVSNDLNCMFGWSLLFIFATSFFGCTINMYYVIIFHLRAYDIEQYISCLFWMTAYLFKVLYLINYSSKASREASRTIDLLHLILNQTDFSETQLQVELKAFCLQLGQCKVQFKAAGFFTIDYALLFQFVAGVLSNVVFVVQFDKINFSQK